MSDYKRAIAIDFDGTLCTNNYPDIGDPNWNIIYQAIQEQKHGTGLILWTCRNGELLNDAIEACAEWGLHFDSVNESIPEWLAKFGPSRKVGANEYWDDKAVAVKDGALVIEDNDKISIDELKEMDGFPVWCKEADKWCLVSISDHGIYKGTPFVYFVENGCEFTWNVKKRNLSCYRNKVVD